MKRNQYQKIEVKNRSEIDQKYFQSLFDGYVVCSLFLKSEQFFEEKSIIRMVNN